MNRLILPLLAASLTLAHAQTGAQVFVATLPGTVVLLQWTEAGGQLRGSAQVVSSEPSARGPKLTVLNSGLSGTRSGADYSLVFDKAVLGQGVASAPATLQGGTLNLNIPSSEGGLRVLPFTRSSIQAFNVAVTDLKNASARTSSSLGQQQQIDSLVEQLGNQIASMQETLSTVTSQDQLREVTARVLSATQLVKGQVASLKGQDATKQCAILTQAGTVRGDQESDQQVLDSLLYVATAPKVLTGVLSHYMDLLAQLKAVSPQRAAQLATQNAPVIQRAQAAVQASSSPAVGAGMQALTAITAQFQAFDSAQGAVACP